MIFNSLQFVIFFPLVLLLATLLRARVVARNVMLLAASYYFYGIWDWRFLGLLMLSTVIDWGVGRALGPKPVGDAATAAELQRRRVLLIVSCVVNLSILGFFKYYGFFASSVVEGLRHLGVEAHPTLLHVVLPVGISFYTFQSMSYTIDVYRGDLPPEKSLLNFALYVAFFPQLVAGPIERATTLVPQVQTQRRARREDLYYGFYLICWGLFKKVVIADNAAPIADMVFAAKDPGGLTVLIGVYAFAVQIYGDFSGYTDIARGTARMLGFDLMENFNHPYFAVNPSDFWRRWHISLSTWLRDYLYIPLGGSRKGERRTYINLMTTMVLGGLWHGAAWNFVFWGIYHGGILCIHRLAQPWLDRFKPRTNLSSNAWLVVRVVFFFHVTCLGWLFFRASSAPQVWQMVSAVVTRPHFDRSVLNDTAILTFFCTAGTMFLIEVVQYWSKEYAVVFRWPVVVRAMIYAAGILAFALFGNYQGVQFIYFQF